MVEIKPDQTKIKRMVAPVTSENFQDVQSLGILQEWKTLSLSLNIYIDLFLSLKNNDLPSYLLERQLVWIWQHNIV